MTTETEKAYLAGLMDGEGHIGITTTTRRNNGYYRIHAVIATISNTHLETLKWAQILWAKGTLVVRTQPQQRVPIGNLRWSGAGAVKILKEMLPYLRIKHLQAVIALEFAEEKAGREYRTKIVSEEEWARREELRIMLRQLNRPDPSILPMPYPVERYQKACAFCGTVFLRTNGSNRKYCSPKCEHKANWQRQKAKMAIT